MITEYLPYIVDGVSLAVLFVFFAVGWKNGFASQMVRTFAVLFAVVITYFLYARLASLLISAGAEDFLVEHIRVQSTEVADLKLPSLIRLQLSENNTAEVYEALGVTSMLQYLKHSLARIIINGISILAVFVVSLVLLLLLSGKLKHLNKLPLVGLANEILGGICSLAVGWVLVTFVIFILTAIGTGSASMQPLSDAIDRSYITLLMQKLNLFTGWFIRII